MAMSFRESSHNTQRLGDYKDGVARSVGAFQIRVDFPGRPSIEQAKDPKFAAKWALNHLLSHNYTKDPYYAISRYNGAGPKAQAYANAVHQTAAKYEKEGI